MLRRADADDVSVQPAQVGAFLLGQPQTLGRCELLVPVGRGGMATVWAARQRGTRGFSTIVAVKTMLPSLSSDRRFERMFLAEAEIASKIKHPNVCPILDLGEDRGVLYLVMEWLDGEPVSTLLEAARERRAAIPHGIAALVVAGVARGLHAAHELGVVHRDVSPQNILVTVDGVAKVVDFGVAKAAQQTEQTTDSGFIKGKVAYLSPEQVQGPNVDRRADIFALGTVLYEMTTGEHPFLGRTNLETLLRISSKDVPPELRSSYPDLLRAIVERALMKDPEARYPTMRDLAADLEAFAADEAVTHEAVAVYVAGAAPDRRAGLRAAIESASRAVDARSAKERSRRYGGIALVLAVLVVVPAILLGARAPGERREPAEDPKPVASPALTIASPLSVGSSVEKSVEVAPSPPKASKESGVRVSHPPTRATVPVPAESMSSERMTPLPSVTHRVRFQEPGF